MAAVLEVRGIAAAYGDVQALWDVTLSVEEGTVATLLGSNGAGKTTTLRLLLGLVRPNAGSATVLGCALTELDRYLPRVGALIEAPAFYPSLSGRTNLEVLALLGGHRGSRVNEMLETVDLSGRAGDRVGTYSLGMKQRLGVAMALLPDPDLLVLDEPANGLDPLGIVEMRELLRRLRDQGKTILLSSHLLGELEHVADWLVMLHEGRALFCGSAKDLLAQRVELSIEPKDAVQRELITAVANQAGYAVTQEAQTLRIACPAAFADTLKCLANEAGVVGLTIRVQEASLEQIFLALVKGEQS